MMFKEEFEDIKEVIRIRISKDRHHNGQTYKQWSTKQHIENQRSSSTNST